MRRLLHLLEMRSDSSELRVQGTNAVFMKNLSILLAVCLTLLLYSSQALQHSFVLKNVLLVFTVLQSLKAVGLLVKHCCVFLCGFTALHLPFLYCTVTLLALVFVYSSQLPPSHPAAPPEHLKEPLAYMRKAQVSLSALISVTPHLLFFYLSDSYSCLPNLET